jgi:hypothetical protein
MSNLEKTLARAIFIVVICVIAFLLRLDTSELPESEKHWVDLLISVVIGVYCFISIRIIKHDNKHNWID